MENKAQILCAAVWYKDGRKWAHQPSNISQGFVVAGHRHHNCFTTVLILAESLGVDMNKCPNEQGFLTRDYQFVGREAAASLAFATGQIPEKKTRLFSEDLY